MTEQPIRIGSPLRDAAVDPRPSDFQAPVNAGKSGAEGNPHSGHVVSVQPGTLPDGRIPAVADAWPTTDGGVEPLDADD